MYMYMYMYMYRDVGRNSKTCTLDVGMYVVVNTSRHLAKLRTHAVHTKRKFIFTLHKSGCLARAHLPAYRYVLVLVKYICATCRVGGPTYKPKECVQYWCVRVCI